MLYALVHTNTAKDTLHSTINPKDHNPTKVDSNQILSTATSDGSLLCEGSKINFYMKRHLHKHSNPQRLRNRAVNNVSVPKAIDPFHASASNRLYTHGDVSYPVREDKLDIFSTNMRPQLPRRPSPQVPSGLWYFAAGMIVAYVLHCAFGVPKERTQDRENFVASCQASLFEYHEALSEWLSGKTNIKDFQHTWERMRMDDDAVVVQPTGRDMTGNQIKSALQAMNGAAGKGFYTVPTKIALRRIYPGLLLWSFVEEQHMPSSPTQKHATSALCEQGQKGIKWVYLHETKLEEPEEIGTVDRE